MSVFLDRGVTLNNMFELNGLSKDNQIQTLKILSWNICRLETRMADDLVVLNFHKYFDLILLQESWPLLEVKLEGYRSC